MLDSSHATPAALYHRYEAGLVGAGAVEIGGQLGEVVEVTG